MDLFHLLILVVLVILSSSETSTADPRTSVAAKFCNSTPPINGATLALNFVPAMATLSSRVNQNGYGTAIVGNSTDTVYGLGQCYEDLGVGSTDCTLCFSEIRSQLPLCYPKTGSILFLDGCFGRYETYNFFNEIFGPNDTNVCSSVKNSSDPNSFTAAVRDVVGNVSSEAPGNRGFAVGSASYSSSTAYALAQCWQNLNTALCKTCLDAAASSIVSCSPANEGRALYTGCYLRYSTGLFWNVNQSTPSSSGNSNILWKILGPILGGVILIAGIVIWKKKDIWSRRGNSLKDLYGPGISAAISQSNLNFKYKKLKKATNNFSLSNKLGQGSYGAVYKAVLSDGKEVAVKKLFLNTRQWISQFFNEVDLISQVRHRNLVKLLGFSVDGPESLLVYEYYSNRSLDLFIFDATHDKHLNWQQRFDIIQGVAEGLYYLHEESETRIIHRDIKASNILLDEKLKPKITDFGLARSFSEDQTHLSTAIAGTLGYMAPEYVVHGHLTEKADVYSFSILIFEIMTGKRCSGEVRQHAGHFLLGKIWSHYKANTIDKIIDKFIYKESLREETLHVMEVGLLCSQSDPNQRPTMAKVVELLRSRRDERGIVLSDPPFWDVPLEEGEVSLLLSDSTSGIGSRSSDMWVKPR